MSDSQNKAIPPSGEQTATQQIPVHFVRSSAFRVIHADGVWFGADSFGNIHLTFYNDRSPIPRKIVMNANPQGGGINLNEDVTQRDSVQGIEREVEADVIMSLHAASILIHALTENLKMMQQLIAKP